MAILINKEIFTELKSLMGNSFKILIENFITTTENYCNESLNLVTSKDFDSIKIKIHAIKNSSTQIGALEFSEIANNIELKISENKFDEIENDIKKLKEYFSNLKHELHSLLTHY